MPGIFYVSYIAMWILLLIQGLLLLLVYRHFGLAALGTIEGVQRDGLKIGEQALPIEGMTAHAEQFRWVPVPGHSYLLVFVSPNCSPCERILPSILQLATVNSSVEIALVVEDLGAINKLTNKFSMPPTIICLADNEDHVYKDYLVRVTPFAFMIGTDGYIRAKGLCDTAEKLKELLSAGGYTIPYINLSLAIHGVSQKS